MRRLDRAGDEGLTRTDIRDLFGRNLSADRIGAALDLLRRKGRATCETVSTGGRPTEVWRAAK
jgi:predicted transcriptional regulator